MTPEKTPDLFRIKNSVETELKGIYKTKYEEEAGVKLEDKDFEGISAFLSRQALNNPDKFLETAKTVKEYLDLPKKIDEKIKVIYSRGSLAKMEEAIQKVHSAREVTGYVIKALWKVNLPDIKDFKWTEIEPINRPANETVAEEFSRYTKYLGKAAIRTYDALNWTVRAVGTASKEVIRRTPIMRDYLQTEEEIRNEKNLKEKYGVEPQNTGEALRKVREEMKRASEAKLDKTELEKKLNELKEKVFSENFAPTVIISRIVQEKLTKEWQNTLAESAAPDKASIDKLFAFKERIGKISSDIHGVEAISEELEDALTTRAKLELLAAIRNMPTVDELEQRLKPFLEKDDNTRRLLLEGIKKTLDAAEGKTLPPEGRAKIDLLKVFLKKKELEEIEARLKESSKTEQLKKRREELTKIFS